MRENNYVITVGRQLGSGGGAVAKRLSEYFGFQYIDKEVLIRASKELDIPEENLEWIEEKNFSIWGSLLQANVGDLSYVSPEWYMPTGRQLFETQTRIILEAAREGSCVVVGRCGSHLFRNHPRHVGVFICADEESRLKRLAGFVKGTGEDGRKAIEKADKERARYFNTYTGGKWLDIDGYDMTIDSSDGNLDRVAQTIIHYTIGLFPELARGGVGNV